MGSDVRVHEQADPDGGVSARWYCHDCGSYGPTHYNDRAAARAEADAHQCPDTQKGRPRST